MRKTFKALEARFTELVAEYFNKPGLIIDTNAMSGSQGEFGKVALTDGKVTYMIYMHSDTEYGEQFSMYNCVKITVELGEYTSNGTFWLGAKEHTVSYQETWYKLGYRCDRAACYTDDIEEIKAGRAKGGERYRARQTPDWKLMNAKNSVILNIVKAKTGRKRVNAENLVAVYKRPNANSWKIVTMFNSRENTIFVKNNEG